MTLESRDFYSGKMLIDTNHFPFIEQGIVFSVDGFGYDIYVSELSRDSHSIWVDASNKQHHQPLKGEDE